MWIHQVSANSELEGGQLGNEKGLSLSMSVFVTLHLGLADCGRGETHPACCLCLYGSRAENGFCIFKWWTKNPKKTNAS